MPGWISFQRALRYPRRTQERILRGLLAANRNADFGRSHGFEHIRSPEEFAAGVPLSEYEDFAGAVGAVRRGAAFGLTAERPVLLEPTSGSSGAAKLIPMTTRLQREFAAAIHPWIAWLYLAHPRLFLGRQYWAVSPHTPVPAGEAESPHSVPVGFADDADYLGLLGRFLSHGILANPPELRRIVDPESFAQVTLIFLLREKNLRLISVWHPSFLTVLLDAIPRHLPAILQALRTGELPKALVLPAELRVRLAARLRADPKRATSIEALDLAAHRERVGRVWPRLELISCWAGNRSEPWLGQLRTLFPQADIQGKGLLATEGCVSVTTGHGRMQPCAVRSHYLEFVPVGGNVALPVWAVEQGGEYSVVLTNGGGLWRYRLHDQVRVTGFCHATPCVEFLGKDNAVSDLVGEKLAERHVSEAIAAATSVAGFHPRFAMVVSEGPSSSSLCGYRLLLELSGTEGESPVVARSFAEVVEGELCRNYYYAHARHTGQLAPVRPVLIQDGIATYRAAREALGTRAGTLKLPALETGNAISPTWWRRADVREAESRV